MTSLESSVIEKINEFLVEFEEAQITPNRLIINKEYLEIAKKYFPELFINNYFKSKESHYIKIITTEDDYLGVGLVFDFPLCYNIN